MKNLLVASALLASALLSFSAEARDDVVTLEIKPAVETAKAKEALHDVPFYFAGQSHPEVAQSMGVISTSRKTNAFGKSDREACEWVLLSALKVLQENARENGYDAVINIKSNYNHNEFASAEEFQCGTGFLMAGVALKGEVVKFK